MITHHSSAIKQSQVLGGRLRQKKQNIIIRKQNNDPNASYSSKVIISSIFTSSKQGAFEIPRTKELCIFYRVNNISCGVVSTLGIVVKWGKKV